LTEAVDDLCSRRWRAEVVSMSQEMADTLHWQSRWAAWGLSDHKRQ